ncbi:5-methyltetrahydropteroyltriglutamate--homocysteine methyltransferase [Facklamia miroungae]|uniref:5-methyltetrahydropteroyltriglutamate--homocysteine methyltransferase n=1 Tax=Facklamia miroungae TaxID=120956 RepID=A0A1G7UNK7_9LACT|nr:5-methyltetrahydropteroyltriglutamate--homocysteine methyltransferase [Facklamia miroungae]
METIFKPFTTTLIGSMPRSPQLLAAKKSCQTSNECDHYEQLIDEETQAIMDLFDWVGIDVVVSGEISRDNFMSYVAEKVEGIELFSTDEINELIGHNEDYIQSLEEMDASDNSMNSPVCIGKLNLDADLCSQEHELIKRTTKKPYKITLPSPYLLTRSMWVEGISDKVYDTRRQLGKDVVQLLKNTIHRLYDDGARVIQIDEPILSEIVFQRSQADTSFY